VWAGSVQGRTWQGNSQPQMYANGRKWGDPGGGCRRRESGDMSLGLEGQGSPRRRQDRKGGGGKQGGVTAPQGGPATGGELVESHPLRVNRRAPTVTGPWRASVGEWPQEAQLAAAWT